MTTDELWPIPDDLAPAGRLAAETIRDFLIENRLTDHGGGGKFHSPQAWTDRGEEYGTGSLLIITHDGGDHEPVFNHAYSAPQLVDALRERLIPQGVFVEQCTSWFSAVYPI